MIRIGGMTPLTSIDFPGRLAAVLYLQGCPWRCSYCHNPELLEPRGSVALPWADVERFLARRVGLLDGVVFSGGEPTLQPGLIDAVARVRSRGFQTGLHTGGMIPSRLRALLPTLDWVGLDIKAPDDWHDTVTGRRGSAMAVRASLQAVLDSGVDCECRTTWHAGLFPVEALYRLAEDLLRRGVRRWVLQICRDREGRTMSTGGDRQSLDPARLGAGFSGFAIRSA